MDFLVGFPHLVLKRDSKGLKAVYIFEKGRYKMSINLQKGQKIDLTKNNPSLKKIIDSYDFIFTVEEHNVTGGLGGAVAEVISGCPDRKAVIHRLGLQNCFASIVGDHDYLCEQYGISDEKIANTVRGIMVK